MVWPQVAVAKHLGLTALRLTDGIILPLNTTQYTFELEDYLQLFVFPSLPTKLPHLHMSA